MTSIAAHNSTLPLSSLSWLSAVSALFLIPTPGGANTTFAELYNSGWFYPTPGIALADEAKHRAAEPGRSLPEKLAAKNTEFRAAVAQVAMYLRPKVHQDLLRQLDDLLDPDGWEVGSPLPISGALFDLCEFLAKEPTIDCPGLGLSDSGHLVAVWREQRRQVLTVRFLSSQRVQWTYIFRGDGPSWGRAGDGPAGGLMQALRQNQIVDLLSA